MIILLLAVPDLRTVAAEPVSAAAGDNDAFAGELYGKLRTVQGNLFFSPYSISAALAMAYAGARENTAKQMAEVLHFGPQEQFHAAFGALQTAINEVQKAGQVKLNVANSLWIQKDYALQDSFLDITGKHYGATPFIVDFVGATEPARQKINTWVEDKTQDKIKELIKPGVLDAMTRMVLANAIYFKGDWASQFKKSATQDEPFSVAPAKTVSVPLMYQENDFGYRETSQYQALTMPYAGKALSMVVMLPKTADGLSALEADLTASHRAVASRSGQRKVRVYLPRFKMTSEFGLGDTLISMGMTDAFDGGKADFSGMSGKKDLCISAVIHKAFVDVNEEGTEAAAATAVVMKRTAMAIEPEPAVFRADHPFLFLIRHDASGAILFMGRVVNPAP